jgi:glycosyltransferase involved in cell wall biosynthesis
MAAEALGNQVRLVAFGRGVDQARAWLEAAVGSGVEVVTEGVLSSQEVSERLRQADVQLFVRGCASSRRGSLVAGIAHGLPIVAFRGAETSWPITEAGIELVPDGDLPAAARAIVRIAEDPEWAARSRAREREVYDRYLSWERIAGRLMGGEADR